jgi:acyl-coenzyme A thioesterase PaaI-like protein
VSGMLLVARAEAALSAQLDVTAELRLQLHAMQERAEAAEAKVVELERRVAIAETRRKDYEVME